LDGVSKKTLRDALSARAETLFRLAEEQDHESANIDSLPPNPVEERPVVQQQQQVQSEDHEKKG
jgi:hypothetical protein